jgi:hypothetical protein
LDSRIKANPHVSIRQCTRELKIDPKTARLIAKKDLKVRSHARIKKQLINQSTKEKRLDRYKILLNELEHKSMGVVFFTDEKNFDLDSVLNSRFDCYLSSKPAKEVPEHVCFKFRTKHPQSIMMFSLVATNGKAMPPFWPKGARINADTYVKLLRTVVKPWIKANYGPDEKWTFQPDGPPATWPTRPRSGWGTTSRTFGPSTSGRLTPQI